MKTKVRMWMAGVFLAVASSVMAQDIPAQITQAFRKGDAAGLNLYLDQETDLVIDNSTQAVSKGQTVAEMQVFFNRNRVKSFQVDHQGTRNESGFLIGTLQTEKGAYRIQCFLSKKEDSFLIHQIRIDGTGK